MIRFLPTILLTLIATIPLSEPTVEDRDGSVQMAAICFKTGERSSGMNKICYYDCLGSEAAITISSTELCPLSIEN